MEELLEDYKENPYEYAEKAEIDAAIHTDPVFAKSLGLVLLIVRIFFQLYFSSIFSIFFPKHTAVMSEKS